MSQVCQFFWHHLLRDFCSTIICTSKSPENVKTFLKSERSLCEFFPPRNPPPPCKLVRDPFSNGERRERRRRRRRTIGYMTVATFSFDFQNTKY
jgi:hypothetical protein